MGLAKIGDTLELSLRLWDRDAAKFVRARIFDEDETEIVGSPAALAHIADGLYFNDSLLYPNTRRVLINYDVFEDAGFTDLSCQYLPALDIIEQDTADQGVQILLSQVIKPDDVVRIEAEANMEIFLKDEFPLCAISSEEKITEVIVQIVDAAERLVLKGMVNASGINQPAFQLWAHLDTNNITLADANELVAGGENKLFDFAGINESAVLSGGSVDLIKSGRVAGGLVGLGAKAGARIFMDVVSGQMTLTDPGADPTAVLVYIGQAVPAVGALTTDEAKDLWVEAQIEG